MVNSYKIYFVARVVFNRCKILQWSERLWKWRCVGCWWQLWREWTWSRSSTSIWCH